MEPLKSGCRPSDELYAQQLDRTLHELELAVRQHEDTLAQLTEVGTKVIRPLPDATQAAIASLDALAKAYQAVTESEPFLPSQDSVLPALLALRSSHTVSSESRHCLESQAASLAKTKRQLQVEEMRLRDQKALQAALEKRMHSLQEGIQAKAELTIEQLVKVELDELKKQTRDYDEETKKLLASLRDFIDTHLSVMLAAEELGGPVVGDMMDIDAAQLGARLSSECKTKRAHGAKADENMRQRRIDAAWGGRYGQDIGAWDEIAAAGAEMRELIEQLLNRLMDSRGDSSAAYVKLSRESAAARFLVRSKVAQFHPKDATRLRLVDFGRELDD